MKRTRTNVSLIAVATLVASVAADAAPRVARIHYAEPVALPGLPALAAAGMQKPAGTARTGFEAFGRRFDLQLESNDRVLRKLSPATRAALPAHALYAGTVVGLPGSWVRLTRLGNGVEGLIFDGNDLYVLAPAGAVRSEVDNPLPGVAEAMTVIYRAADVDSGLGPDFCRVLAPPASAAASSGGATEPAYKAIFAELATNAGAITSTLPTKELDLALVGDTQLAAAIPATSGEMLARLNNVDGIFSAQVGVRVTSGFVKVLANNGGMSATAADQLLDQFEAYRKATPEASSRGAAHLMTGRNLDGATVGIAYLGTLCAPQFAVSLSQTYLDTFNSSLVAAHELGHTFGAPHDGASGSACATTPQVYLMAPSINGSSTFSQCSLDQIAPLVSAATCLTPAMFADVGVEFASSTLSAYAVNDVHVPISVVSGGNRSIDQVSLDVREIGILTIMGASVPGGTCTTDGTTLTCQLGTLPANTTRQVDLVVRSNNIVSTELRATVHASGDTVPANNQASATITFSSPADGSIRLAPNTLSAYVGETQSFAATVSNSGPLPLENAAVVMQDPGLFAFVAAGGSGVSCAKEALGMTCTVGTIPAGESRRIDFSVIGLSAWVTSVPLFVRSSNDLSNANNTQYVTIQALPLVELTVDAVAGPALIKLGSTITQSFTLGSAGPQPVEGASLLLQPGQGIEIVSVTGPGATCAPSSEMIGSYVCTYAAAIESGGTRRVDAVLKAVSGLSSTLVAQARAPNSQHLDAARGFLMLQYDLRSDVDLRLGTSYGGATTYDHRTLPLILYVDSIGLTPAANSQLTLTIPQGVSATGLATNTGSCATNANKITCAFGTMASGPTAQVGVMLVADAPGNYVIDARIAADSDSNPSNDDVQIGLDVRPNVDLSLTPLSTSMHVRSGSVVDLPVTVTAASQPVGNSVVTFNLGSGISAIGATPSQGSCEAVSTQFRCTLDTVPGGASATVNLRIRGEFATQTILGISATGTGDVDASNGRSDTMIVVDPRGNVSLQAGAPDMRASVGVSFDLPQMTLRTITASDDVRVSLTVPSAFSIDGATADNAPCSVNAGAVSCAFGSLSAGQALGIHLRLRPIRSGTFRVTSSAAASDDSDMTDNSANVSVTVAKSNAGGGSGGGGGGALDPATLVLLMAAPVLLRRRRKPR